MLNVSLNANVLTVVTPIAKEIADKAFSPLTAYDEGGNQECLVNVSNCGCGEVSSMGLTCNTVVDGKLAVVLTLPMDTTMDDVKKKYGQAIVNVNKYIDEIAEAAKAEIEAIDNIFKES